jgi:hypothetical protein
MPQAYPAIAAILASQVVRQIIITIALTLLQKALQKKPARGAFAQNVTIRSTIAERHLIIGTARATGSILFYGTSGSGGTFKYLWYVVAYATHQCSALKDCWLDKAKIPAADINGATGAVSTAVYSGKLKIWDHLGTGAQAVDANLDPEFTEWTANHRLRGVCYRVIRFERDADAWPAGAPQSVTSLVDGALLYDPRLDTTNGGAGAHRRDDPSTWAFSHNWALGTRWFLSGGSVVNDQVTRLIKFGLQESDSRIDDAYTITAANIADQSVSGANAPPSGAQPRYTLDIEVSCGQLRRDILEELLMCGGPGQLVYVHGKWRIYAAAYDSPVHTFTQDDLAGAIDVDDTTGDEDRFNSVSAVHIDASKDYGEATCSPRTNAAYVTQDASQTITREIQVRGCSDTYRAQRICELILRDARQMRTAKFPFLRQGLKVAPWETFSFSHTPFGWSGRVFRCIERDVQRTDKGGMICLITAKQVNSSVFTDLVTADYTTGTSATNSLQSEPPDPPTALTITTRNGAMLFDITVAEFWKLNGIFELWEYTSSTPFASATKIWEGRVTSWTIEKTDTTTRYYWVRVRTIGGQTSTTFPAATGQAGVAYYPVIAPTTVDTPADGNVAYTAGVQPRVEVGGINSHITYTSPASVATRCVVNYSGQADVSNTTSGVATGYASLLVTVQVNGVTAWTRERRLEAVLNSADAWGELSGSKAFDVPAGQAIDVYLSVGRTFSTAGASPAQTIYWRACHTEIMPTKQT